MHFIQQDKSFCLPSLPLVNGWNCSNDFVPSADFYSSCSDPKAKPSRTMRSAERSPRWCQMRSAFKLTSVLYFDASRKTKSASFILFCISDYLIPSRINSTPCFPLIKIISYLRLLPECLYRTSQFSARRHRTCPGRFSFTLQRLVSARLHPGLPRHCVQGQGQTGPAGRDRWVPGRGDRASSWRMGPGHQDRAAQEPPPSGQKV